MRVITFTSLFPNTNNPNFCSFVARRMETWAGCFASKWVIIAPVPFFPDLPFPTAYDGYSKIKKREHWKQWQVFHPRYLMLPKFGTRFQGASMAIFSHRSLSKVLRDKGPFDLIDAHYVYPDGYAALKLSNRFGVPFVITARGTDINLYPSLPGIQQKIRRVLLGAHAIIGVSRTLCEKMVALGAAVDRCHVIPNGVDLDIFHPAEDAATSRPTQQLIAVGNLKPEKGFHILLDAMKILTTKHPNIRLCIVGSGPEEKRLKRKRTHLALQDNVLFTGPIPNEKLPHYYRTADVFCLASLREGCPNVVLEALASGVPVVATPVGGIPDIIRNGVNGILAEDNTPEAMANAIIQALKRTWDSREIHTTVKDRSWMKVADEINVIFEEVLLQD
jgi:teichuronic acid biosynthesis glycosyltransferase TuaC